MPEEITQETIHTVNVDSTNLISQLRSSEYKTMSKESRQKMIAIMKQCNADSINLANLQVIYNKANADLQVANHKVDSLTAVLDTAKQSPIYALTSPSGCAVVIVLIICLTIIAIKKGVNISKGDAKVSIGDNNK